MNKDEALKKLQLNELEILKTIAALCDEHGIAWFIDAGTLLGAARHQGFIPWDDDIDIAMLRSDFDRFIEVARGHLPDGYSLHTFGNTPGFPLDSALRAELAADETPPSDLGTVYVTVYTSV